MQKWIFEGGENKKPNLKRKLGCEDALALRSVALPSKESTGRSPGLQLPTYSPRLPIPIFFRKVAGGLS